MVRADAWQMKHARGWRAGEVSLPVGMISFCHARDPLHSYLVRLGVIYTEIREWNDDEISASPTFNLDSFGCPSGNEFPATATDAAFGEFRFLEPTSHVFLSY